jgi:hypothetical protein
MDCVNCLIRFANNKTSHRISLKAIALLRICEDRLAEVCYMVFTNRIFFYNYVFLLAISLCCISRISLSLSVCIYKVYDNAV